LARELLDATPDPLVVVDERGVIRFANQQTAVVLGYARDELIGAPVSLLIPVGLVERHHSHVAAYLRDPKRRPMGARLPLRARRADGAEIPVDVSLSPVLGKDGATLVIATIRDITDRRQIEEAHAQARREADEADEARSRLASILANIPDYVMNVDRSGIVEFTNRRSSDAVFPAPGMDWTTCVEESLRDSLRAALDRVVDEGESTFVEIAASRGGDRVWLEGHVSPIREEGVIVGATISARDVTEKKRTEDRLVVSDRMAAMGTLAAGVGHELNNPLAAVIANLDIAWQTLMTMTDPTAMRAEILDCLADAREGADRMRLIVQDLRMFSRVEDPVIGPVQIIGVLESSIRMASNEIRQRARIVRRLAEVPPAVGNANRLGQVFLNILVNAAQAIPEGAVEANEVRVSTRLSDAGEIVVEIADTGQGMAPETVTQIFNPFFTTKPAGIGTGLGLAICHRIITAQGGRIEVESTLGMGTLFRLFLSPATTALEVGAPTRPSEPAAARARGRVLIIDDDASVARALGRIFEGRHDVTIETFAQAALAHLAQGERFDVIFCDLMMPEMSGPQCFEAIERAFPDAVDSVVFLTGGAFTPSARALLARVPNRKIDKPFDPQALLDIVDDRMTLGSGGRSDGDPGSC